MFQGFFFRGHRSLGGFIRLFLETVRDCRYFMLEQNANKFNFSILKYTKY